MNFSDLANTVKSKGASLLGSVLSGAGTGLVAGGAPGAVIGGIGSLINGVAGLFNADASNPDDVIKKINADPEAALKLKQFQIENEVKLFELASQRIDQANLHIQKMEQLANSDLADARKMNAEGKTPKQKWVDEGIKLSLVLFTAFLISMCIYGLITKTISGEEVPILTLILGAALNELKGYNNFYYSSSKSSQNKDRLIENYIENTK
jgi:hypothetical protein